MRIADIRMMREMDRLSSLTFGIPGIILMENAAMAVKRQLDLTRSYFVIVSGPGNNGGDGLALARHLKASGKEVDVFVVTKDGNLKGDARVNFDILEKMEISMSSVMDTENLGFLTECVKKADVVIDALLGTGARGPLSDLFTTVIGIINDFAKVVISVDVPSGLDADTGLPMPVAIHADKTVAFQCMKRGFLGYEAMEYLGELIVEDIGIPEAVMEIIDQGEYLTEICDIERILPRRGRTEYKTRYGRVLVVAGSRGFTGAALISAEAAISTGSGLVTLSSHKNVMENLVPQLREIMSLYPEELEEGVRKSDVVAFGPGLGSSEKTYAMLLRVIRTMEEEGRKEMTLVLDADGLNVLQGRCEILKSLHFNVILTPHPGEMSRLTGLSPEMISEDRIGVAREFAKEHGIIMVLKGYHTVITDGKSVYVNPTGSSAMAQGGMGDALTGIIASLAGQGIDPFDAAVLGTYLHGYSGDTLSKKRYCVKASEVIRNIPFCMKRILNSKDSGGCQSK